VFRLHRCEQIWSVLGEHANKFLALFVHAFGGGQSLGGFVAQQAHVAQQAKALQQENLVLRFTFLFGHHVVAKLGGHDLGEFHSPAFDVAFDLDEGL